MEKEEPFQLLFDPFPNETALFAIYEGKNSVIKPVSRFKPLTKKKPPH